MERNFQVTFLSLDNHAVCVHQYLAPLQFWTIDRFSQNLVWTLRRWRTSKLHNNVANARTCHAGATLAPLTAVKWYVVMGLEEYGTCKYDSCEKVAFSGCYINRVVHLCG